MFEKLSAKFWMASEKLVSFDSIDHRLYQAARSIHDAKIRLLATHPELGKEEGEPRSRDTRIFQFEMVIEETLLAKGWPRNLKDYPPYSVEEYSDLNKITYLLTEANTEFQFRVSLNESRNKTIAEYLRMHIVDVNAVAQELVSFKIEDIRESHYHHHHALLMPLLMVRETQEYMRRTAAAANASQPIPAISA